MNNPLKNDDIYKILSESFGRLREQEQEEEDFGLEDVPLNTKGGHRGRLAPTKGIPTKVPGPESEKATTDDPRPPQPGTTERPSAGQDAGRVPTSVDTSGTGQEVTPEEEPGPGGSDEVSPEAPEDTEGMPGQAGMFTADDFMIPDGAVTSKVSTLNAKIQTKTGMLTIINRGISPDADFMDEDPPIIYTIISKKGEDEKRKNVNVPYSVVRGGERTQHFAKVLNHIRGVHTTSVAGDEPPELPEDPGGP